MSILKFALKRSLQSKTNLIFIIILPIGLIFLPIEPDSWTSLPYGYHYFGTILLFVSVRLAAILLEDRQQGIIKRIAMAPVSNLSYLTQNVLAFSLILLLPILLLISGGIFYGHELYHTGRLFLLYVCFAFAALSMSLAWVSIYRNKETSFLVFMVIVVLMTLVSGIMLPIEIMPDNIEKVAYSLPTYWYNKGLTAIVSQASLPEFLLPLVILLAFSLLFLLIGSKRKIV